MVRLLRRLAITLGIAVTLMLGASVPSSAASIASEDGPTLAAQGANTVDPSGDPATNACGVATESGDQATNYLPVERWAASTGMFPINPERGSFDISTMIQESSTQMFGGTLYGVSSSIWQLNVAVADIGMRFCPMEHLGYYIDNLVGTFGEVLLDGGGALLVGVLVLTTVMVIWQGRRSGQFDFGMIIGKTAAIAVLTLMVAGAAQSTNSDDGYQPVWYSPGGIISTLNNVSTTLGTGVVESTMDAVSQDISSTTAFEDRHPAHCQNMIDAGHEAYGYAAGDGGAMVGGLSQTWSSTVYASWSRALLGDDFTSSNGASGHGYIPCRLAEWESGMPQVSGTDEDQDGGEAWDRSNYLALAFAYGQSDEGSLDLTESGDGGNARTPLAAAADLYSSGDGDPRLPWDEPGSSDRPTAPIVHTERSQQMYALLASGVCYQANFPGGEPSLDGDMNPEFGGVFEGNDLESLGNNNEDWYEICESLYLNTDGEDNNPLLAGGYPVHGTGSDIREDIQDSDGASPSPEGMTSLIALMVSDNMFGSISEGSASAITSVSVMIVLVPVMVVLMLVRLLMVMLIIGMVLSLVAGLLPGRSFEPFMRILKMTVGVVLLSMFVQVIFALIMTLMLLLNDLGAQVVDPGTVAFALWSAVTPWLAVIGLHLVFKFLKIPSPLKVSSAMEWGNALSKQGADSIGAKVGSSAENAGDKAKSMGKKMSGSSSGSSSEGTGAERQRGDQQTKERVGSQRGADAQAAEQSGAPAGESSAESSSGAGVTAAKDRVGSAKAAAKNASQQQRSAQRAERKSQRAVQKAELREATAQMGQRGDSPQAVDQRSGAMKNQQAADRKLTGEQQARQAAETQSTGASAVRAARGDVSQARKDFRQEKHDNRMARKNALRDARDAERAGRGLTRREGESKGRYAARLIGQGGFRALSATNASEGLSRAQMAKRAAKVGAGVAGVTALAGLGGAPIAAAAAGTALGGLGAAGARRALNTATSKNAGSMRERASTAAHQRGLSNTLGEDRIGSAVTDYSNRSGQGLDHAQPPTTKPAQPTGGDTDGEDHRDTGSDDQGPEQSQNPDSGPDEGKDDDDQPGPEGGQPTPGGGTPTGDQPTPAGAQPTENQAGPPSQGGQSLGSDPAEEARTGPPRSGTSETRSSSGERGGQSEASSASSARPGGNDRVGSYDAGGENDSGPAGTPSPQDDVPAPRRDSSSRGSGDGSSQESRESGGSGADSTKSSSGSSPTFAGDGSPKTSGEAAAAEKPQQPNRSQSSGAANEDAASGGRSAESPRASAGSDTGAKLEPESGGESVSDDQARAQTIDLAEGEPGERPDRIGNRRRGPGR